MIDFCQLIEKGNLGLQVFDNCFDDQVRNTIVYISSKLKMCECIAFIKSTDFIFIDQLLELPGDRIFTFRDHSGINIVNDGAEAPACYELCNTAAHGASTTNADRVDHNMTIEIFIAISQLNRTDKLLQKTHIVFTEKSYIINAIFKHGRPFNAHSKSKTRILFRIDITIFKHFRMYHTATQDL